MLFAHLYLYRYEADLSEGSSLDQAEPFSLGGLMCPPSQATPRTAANVSLLTVSLGN